MSQAANADIELFNAARAAGMPVKRSVRYVQHVRLWESQGKTPLTPQEAADAPLRTKVA